MAAVIGSLVVASTHKYCPAGLIVAVVIRVGEAINTGMPAKDLSK